MRGNSPTAAMKKRGGIGSMGSGKPTARPKATGRTVYKSRTTIPTRRVAKPTAKKQKSPDYTLKAFKNQIQSLATKTKPKGLQKLKPSTTQTPRQKAIAAAKAFATKQRQSPYKARPTKTTGTLSKPTTLRAAIAARRKAGAQAKARAGFRGRPTGRTVYKSRTTIPTRRRRK